MLSFGSAFARRVTALVAMLAGLWFAALCIAPALAQGRAAGPPVTRPKASILDYVFEHEETRLTQWSLERPRTAGVRRRAGFAYLILDPGKDGLQRRALVIIDGYKNPTTAFFLDGTGLLPVPDVPGTPLHARIDWDLTFTAASSDAFNRTVTARIAPGAAQAAQVKFSLTPALAGLDEKFEGTCLTLPDVMTLSLRGKTFEFAILLPGNKTDPEFMPEGCEQFVAGALTPPAFSWVHPARLYFAFTTGRLVILHDKYVVSIPYDLDDDALRRSPFVVAKADLDRILNDFHWDPPATTDLAGERFVKRSNAAQQGIDGKLLALLKLREAKH